MMKRNLPHVFLRNPQGISRQFDRSRNTSREEVDTKPGRAYRDQKKRLDISYSRFLRDRESRSSRRSFDVPANIDYLQIHFYMVFGDRNLRRAFEGDFGLSPVRFTDFNKTVLFAITDESKFNHFISLLRNFIESPNDKSPRGTAYAIIATIHDFQFLTREVILRYCRNSLVLDLITVHQSILHEYEAIKPELLKLLSELDQAGEIGSFQTDGETFVEIHEVNDALLHLIVDNFDILCTAHSLRTPRITPNTFNVGRLDWGIRLRPQAGAPLIGILDNGVCPIPPIEDIIYAPGLAITDNEPNPTKASLPHGTNVASLAAVGTQLFDTTRTEFTADAVIFPIKIIENFDGTFQVHKLIEVIKKAVREYGVKVFNLSVCAQTKTYNEAPSVLAFHLDRLAYEYDLLIFIATGNLYENDMMEMQSLEHRNHPLHQYPYHFYSPKELSDCHACEATNLCTPAESINNMTVGAIADNLRDDSTDLTLSKELPAFYTRKNHYDYTRLINGSPVSQAQMNWNLSKPDIVMPGGDRLRPESGMQVFGFGENGNDYYLYDSGTSLAAPLAANLAAKILRIYPDLRMQSVKALIINSANYASNDSFLNELEVKIKNRLSNERFGVDFDQLLENDKREISKRFSKKNFYRALMGYGKPDETKILYSNDKAVTFVIENEIEDRTHQVIPIRIPSYLMRRNQQKRLYIRATLCFKTFPSWGNHLDYNPLHISFNFIRQLDNDPNQTADILANKQTHSFFDTFYEIAEIQNEEDEKTVKGIKNKERNRAMGIKSKIGAWSEDYFPPISKPYSTTQQLDIHIQKDELKKVNGQIALVVRCTLKDNLTPAVEAWARAQTSHPFSIVLSIEEETSLFNDYSLYDQLAAVNELEPIVNLEAEAVQGEANV